LSNILKENKLITNNLGELPPVLAQRLVDSNSKIAAAAIAICQDLGSAMGNQCKTHVRTVFPPLLQDLGDSKVSLLAIIWNCKTTMKRREECDSYLIHVCRHRWSGENPMKR
jgi:hypothetical protein